MGSLQLRALYDGFYDEQGNFFLISCCDYQQLLHVSMAT